MLRVQRIPPALRIFTGPQSSLPPPSPHHQPKGDASRKTGLIDKIKGMTSRISGAGEETPAATVAPVFASATTSTATAQPAIPAGQAAALRSRRENAAGVPATTATGATVGVGTAARVPNGGNGKTLTMWQSYRQSRLSVLAKWIYILVVSLFFIALYCGDFSQQRSKQVLPRLTKKVAAFMGDYSKHMDLLGLPRIDLTRSWNGLADKANVNLSLLGPRHSKALPRETFLYAGDYIYNCVKEGKDSKASCMPTFFQLRDDGQLVLARGTTPSKPNKVLWKSKTGPSKHGKYVATYGKDGSLEVRLGDKKVWRARKFFQPRVLRPWPLNK